MSLKVNEMPPKKGALAPSFGTGNSFYLYDANTSLFVS